MRLFQVRKGFISAVLTVLTVAGAVVAVEGPAQAASLGDQLASGGLLASGDSLDSAGGTYELLMRPDGDLVESGPDGEVIWQTSTGSPGASLLNAADGNLVIQSADGGTVWSTGYDTTRGPAALSIDDTGNLIDQADSGSVLWVTYATPGGSSTRGDGAAKFAREQLGKPYVYGTAGPRTYDNGGLTMAAYAVVGLSLPHDTLSQLAAVTPIDRSQLQVGDLVFYGDGNKAAVYFGNDQVITVLHTGSVVQLASIDFMPVYATGRVA